MPRRGTIAAAIAAIGALAPSAWADPAPYATPQAGRTVLAGWSKSTDERYDDVIALGRSNRLDDTADGIVDELTIECVDDTVVVRELWTEKVALDTGTSGTATLAAAGPADGLEWRFPDCEGYSDEYTYSELAGVPFSAAMSWTATGITRPASHYENETWGSCMAGHGSAGITRGADAALDELRGEHASGWETYAAEYDTVARAQDGSGDPACEDPRADLRGAHGPSAQRQALRTAVEHFTAQHGNRAIPFAGLGADAGEIAVAEWYRDTDTAFDDVMAIGGIDAALAPSTGIIDVFHVGCDAGEFVVSEYWTDAATYTGTPLASAQISAPEGWDGWESRLPSCDPGDDRNPVDRDLTGVPMTASVAVTENGDAAPYTGQEVRSYGLCSDTSVYGEVDRPATATLQLQGSPDVATAGLVAAGAVLAAGGGAGQGTTADSCDGYSRSDLSGRNGRAAQIRAARALRRSFMRRR